jgi:hypothetical protein
MEQKRDFFGILGGKGDFDEIFAVFHAFVYEKAYTFSHGKMPGFFQWEGKAGFFI